MEFKYISKYYYKYTKKDFDDKSYLDDKVWYRENYKTMFIMRSIRSKNLKRRSSRKCIYEDLDWLSLKITQGGFYDRTRINYSKSSLALNTFSHKSVHTDGKDT